MDQDELVSTFCGIADCDPERAKFFLAASNWELEVGVSNGGDVKFSNYLIHFQYFHKF